MRPHGSHSGNVVVEMVDVVLDEDEPVDEFLELLREIALEAIARRATWPGEPHEPVALPPPAVLVDAPAPGRLRRIGTRRLVTGGLVGAGVVAALVAPGVIDARASAGRLAALTAEPGVLAPLAAPPAELWRSPGRLVAARPDVLVVADARTGALARLDPATGGLVWGALPAGAPEPAEALASAFVPETCLTLPASGADEASGSSSSPAGAGPLACVGVAPTATGELAATDRAGFTVLDPLTGAVVLAVTDAGDLLAVEPVGEDLLVAGVLPDQAVQVTRWDLATGDPVWTSLSPVPVTDATDPPAVEVRPTVVRIGDTWLDVASGDPVDPESAALRPVAVQEYVLPSGARASWTWHASGQTGQGRITARALGRAWPLAGPPLVPGITDGSEPSMLVLTNADQDRWSGVDLRSGRSRWSRASTAGSAVSASAQVDGVLLLEGADGVTAVDVSTGEGRWSAPVASDVQHPALVDGATVLLPERDGAGAVQLVARSIRDGAELWRTAAPAGTSALTVVDHHLVAQTPEGLVGLG